MLFKYLCVIFLPPAYFALKKEWGGCVINAILYGMAWLTIWFGVGFLFWFAALLHAGWGLREEMMERHAQMIASKLAKEMKPQG